LSASQENHSICHARVALGEGVHGEKHRANFEDLGSDRHASFAEAVGQESAGHRKQKERESEEIPNNKNQPIFLRISRVPPQDQEDDKEFQAVVVESALELSGDETPKAEPPLFFGRRDGKVHFDRHAGSPKRID